MTAQQRPAALDEVGGALRGEIRRACEIATQQATILRSIAAQITALTEEILVDYSADELNRRAHEIRGVVLHGLSVLSELQHVNGRLEALAAIRRSNSLPKG